MNYIKNNKIIYNEINVCGEIIKYFPENINLDNIKSYTLIFDIIHKILYPVEYNKYYKSKYEDNKFEYNKQILKDVLLCIKHSNDKTYDNLLDMINKY